MIEDLVDDETAAIRAMVVGAVVGGASVEALRGPGPTVVSRRAVRLAEVHRQRVVHQRITRLHVEGR